MFLVRALDQGDSEASEGFVRERRTYVPQVTHEEEKKEKTRCTGRAR